MKRQPASHATQSDPSEIRAIFGQNLRRLSQQYSSVSGLCRELGINRTQFNRYLAGESFPRPDVLHRICQFFDVDARVLLEPVENLRPATYDLLNHPMVEGFFGARPVQVPEKMFPSGFYRFVRSSFIDHSQFVLGLVHISRDDDYTFLRGYESRVALQSQGLSTKPQDREFRGIVLRQEEGIMALVTHRDSLACSFNFLTQETAFQSNIWEGYVTRTVREKVASRRATRMVYEHLGRDWSLVMGTARQAGLISLDEVPPFFARLLRLDQEFR